MVPAVYQLFWAAIARVNSSPTSRTEVGVVGTPTLIVVTGPASSGKTPHVGSELTAATGHPAARDGISWPKALAND
jgi:hypothetical protein